MNHGAMVAVHIAVAAAHARTKVIDALRVQGATAPERAVTLDTLNIVRDDSGLAQLVDAGIVRGVDQDLRPSSAIGTSHWARYYLDEVAYIADRDGTSPAARAKARAAWRGALVAALAGAVIAALIAFLIVRQS